MQLEKKLQTTLTARKSMHIALITCALYMTLTQLGIMKAYKAESHDMGELKTMLEMINEWNKELEKLRNKPLGY